MWFHKKYDFFSMLLEQAKMSEEGLRLLCDFVAHPTDDLGARVESVEKQADELRRTLIFALNRTLVTPFDREDIFALSRAIDDMVDYAWSTVQEMVLFKVETNAHIQKMAAALYQAARHLTRAVEGLRRIDDDLQDHIIQVKKTENLMEHLYREALVDLFQKQDVIALLKLREVYRHLNNAADRGDESADILSDILVKNT